jgi:hypothetical protein
LENAAIARGPGYVGGAEGLLESAAKHGGDARYAVEDLMAHPAWSQAMSEVPAGSQFLGHGAEAAAFQTPGGDVLRLSRTVGQPTRPLDVSMLPATRTVDYASPLGKGGIRAERSPFAPDIAGMDLPAGVAAEARGLPQTMQGRGLDFFDSNLRNVGMHQGRPVVIDPGAVDTLAGFGGGMSPLTTPAAPDRVQRFLLDMLGGQNAMQRSLNAGRSAPAYQKGFGQVGQAAGTTAAAGLEQFGR